MVTERTTFGLEAEKLACTWLENRGYKILDQNWRRPWGELDIVTEKDNVIAFIEVKASSMKREGFDPFLRANRTKMHKVCRAAKTWLSQHKYGPDTEWQLDIISGRELNIESIEIADDET